MQDFTKPIGIQLAHEFFPNDKFYLENVRYTESKKVGMIRTATNIHKY